MKRILILFLISHLALQSDEGDYIFGWSHLDDPMLKAPRGGTTLGPDVKLDKNLSPYWEKLKDNNLSKFEKDRLAILSMQENIGYFLILWKLWVLFQTMFLSNHTNHGEQNLLFSLRKKKIL